MKNKLRIEIRIDGVPKQATLEWVTKRTFDRQELLEVVGEKNVGSVMAGKPCACGLAWGHTGKHSLIVSRTVHETHKATKLECEHGTPAAYFCEDCDGAKITKGLDEEADKKVGREHEKLGMFKGKFIAQMDRDELLDFAKWAGNKIQELEKKDSKCDHVCSSNCRREGCNCACGYFHV